MLEHRLSVLADGNLDRCVAWTVEVMVESSNETTGGGSENVCVAVVVQEVIAFSTELHNRVSGESNANSRVEASTELVSARNAAQKSKNDNHGGANTNAVTSSVLSLNHQDDADKDESAHDLVDKNCLVHGVKSISGSVVRFTSQGVHGSKDGNGRVLFAFGAEVGQANSDETADDLSDDNGEHEQEVLSLISKSAPDADCDSRVEMTSSDISEDDDGRQEGEGDRKWQVG